MGPGLAVQYEYLWADPKYRKPVRLPAPEYISALFDWLELQVQGKSMNTSATLFHVCFQLLFRIIPGAAHALQIIRSEVVVVSSGFVGFLCG